MRGRGRTSLARSLCARARFCPRANVSAPPIGKTFFPGAVLKPQTATCACASAPQSAWHGSRGLPRQLVGPGGTEWEEVGSDGTWWDQVGPWDGLRAHRMQAGRGGGAAWQ